MFRRILSRLVALALVVVVSFGGLTACGEDSTTGLTGKYVEDTLFMVETMTSAIELPVGDPTRNEVQEKARQQMNEYMSRYRRDSKVSGLRSFTTMQTALNALAGFYSSYGNRPISKKLKARLDKEFSSVNIAVKRGI